MRVEKITYLRALLFVHLSKCQDSDPFREIKGVQYPRRRGGMLEWLSWGNLKEGDQMEDQAYLMEYKQNGSERNGISEYGTEKSASASGKSN